MFLDLHIWVRFAELYWPTMVYSPVATLGLIVPPMHVRYVTSNHAWTNLNDSNISLEVQGHNPSSSGAGLEVVKYFTEI